MQRVCVLAVVLAWHEGLCLQHSTSAGCSRSNTLLLLRQVQDQSTSKCSRLVLQHVHSQLSRVCRACDCGGCFASTKWGNVDADVPMQHALERDLLC